ncbi:FdtA/QdtA family cupin domain-containing protein [Amycolatopsis sp. OK19-0408]|uniref:FdtA/QdtA family cupin domain-containing protein n=1 Tax=Amycolatopsis iheyensis TaxID=2945988 RepID=A0A9X2N7R1_9PSEU|nr:FdtA/QdtA family cupin domain-containing protein [Amycolatopsis iheyensis]MCR6483509.1 FdtA/QdtA family cupin domain-containing protein [Amycolatopsis iheyensis]
MEPETRFRSAQPVVGRIDPCRLVDLSEHADDRGRLTVVQPGRDVGFEVRRAFYIHDIPDGAERGAHGHRRERQLIIAVHGGFEVVAYDGFRRASFVLDNPSLGLYVGPMVWCEMTGFAPGSVGLVLASQEYDEADYCRDYDEFCEDARILAA